MGAEIRCYRHLLSSAEPERCRWWQPDYSRPQVHSNQALEVALPASNIFRDIPPDICFLAGHPGRSPGTAEVQSDRLFFLTFMGVTNLSVSNVQKEKSKHKKKLRLFVKNIMPVVPRRLGYSSCARWGLCRCQQSHQKWRTSGLVLIVAQFDPSSKKLNQGWPSDDWETSCPSTGWQPRFRTWPAKAELATSLHRYSDTLNGVIGVNSCWTTTELKNLFEDVWTLASQHNTEQVFLNDLLRLTFYSTFSSILTKTPGP